MRTHMVQTASAKTFAPDHLAAGVGDLNLTHITTVDGSRTDGLDLFSIPLSLSYELLYAMHEV